MESEPKILTREEVLAGAPKGQLPRGAVVREADL